MEVSDFEPLREVHKILHEETSRSVKIDQKDQIWEAKDKDTYEVTHESHQNQTKELFY